MLCMTHDRSFLRLKIWTEGVQPFLHIPDGGIGHTLTDASNLPYQSKPYDNKGNPMPDRLWELVQWCWKRQGSERPTVKVITAILSEIRKRPEVEVAFDSMTASASGSTKKQKVSLPPSPSSSLDEVDVIPFASTSAAGKGKQRAQFNEEYAVVRFGPVDLDGEAEEVFFTIFEGPLLEVVRKGALAEPWLVHEHDSNHLDLHFRSPIEANGFAQTWTVHRFDPYLDCTATLVDST
jgi:hypothetical protein